MKSTELCAFGNYKFSYFLLEVLMSQTISLEEILYIKLLLLGKLNFGCANVGFFSPGKEN